MKRTFPIPLQIDCRNISKRRQRELANRLACHFDKVEFWDDNEITASSPRGVLHYGIAWELIDNFRVKAR